MTNGPDSVAPRGGPRSVTHRAPATAPGIAHIDPERCIGCARCMDACPFDAIIGAPQRMHTVIGDECIGCELCIAPCPVDCIELVDAPVTAPSARQRAAAAQRQRRQRRARHEREERARAGTGPDLSALVAAALRRAGGQG